MLRYPTERLHDPGSERAQCSAPLPPPRCGWWRRRRPAAVPSWRRRCAGRRRHCREAAGGGREARGIPGRGEENEYRGQKVQGGVEVDEAQHGREEEEGSSVGGWAAGPGGGGRARAWRATAMAGDWTTTLRMPPPSRFRGGSLLPPLVNVPVNGDGSTVRGN